MTHEMFNVSASVWLLCNCQMLVKLLSCLQFSQIPFSTYTGLKLLGFNHCNTNTAENLKQLNVKQLFQDFSTAVGPFGQQCQKLNHKTT